MTTLSHAGTLLHVTAAEAQTGCLSRFWSRYLPGAYDRRCTCCLLGQDHTEARHWAEISQYETQEGSKQ
jgi:hypothetical protein